MARGIRFFIMLCAVITTASVAVHATEYKAKVKYVATNKSSSGKIYFQMPMGAGVITFVVRKTDWGNSETEISRALTLLATAANSGQDVLVGYGGTKEGSYYIVDYLSLYAFGY